MAEANEDAASKSETADELNPEMKISDLTMQQLLQLLNNAAQETARTVAGQMPEAGSALSLESKVTDLKLGQLLQLLSTMTVSVDLWMGESAELAAADVELSDLQFNQWAASDSEWAAASNLPSDSSVAFSLEQTGELGLMNFSEDSFVF